jgi:hypothetical protein
VLGVGDQQLIAELAESQRLKVARQLPLVESAPPPRGRLGRPTRIAPPPGKRHHRRLTWPQLRIAPQPHVAGRVRRRVVGPGLDHIEPQHQRRGSMASLMRRHVRINSWHAKSE